jgi:transcriptional regulator with XRE-family HTH domain
MSDKIGIGERLREFANKHGGITQLANRIGISQPRLSQYIAEAREISPDIFIKLNQLGCDLSWLLTGEFRDSIEKKQISKLEEENTKLKGENYRLSLEVSQLSMVAEAVEGYNRLKHKKKG